MSCCYCCVDPSRELLDGSMEQQCVRGTTDLSVLRQQYRSSRDEQKKHSQLLFFRKVSEELSEAVTLNQMPPPPTVTFDPWHAHLDLHRRSSRRSWSSSSEESRSRRLSLTEMSYCWEDGSRRDLLQVSVPESRAPTEGSTTNLHEDLKETQSADTESIGHGLARQNLNHYPFPSKRTPRISEAARRLGMYSSF